MILFALLQLTMLILTDSASSSQKKRVEKRIVIKELKNCEENFVECLVENMTISNLGKGRVGISADLNSTYDFDNIDKVVIEVNKCKGSIKDKCEFFMTVPFEDGCKMVKLKGQLWSPVTLGFKPPLTCPIKKGIHRLRNAEFKMEHLKAFNLGSFFDQYSWIIKVKVFKGNHLLYCLQVGADIISVRV